MAIERRNPLPIGRYWVDIIGEDQSAKWSEWVRRNSSAVRVVTTEHEDATNTPFGLAQPSLDWVLFQVLSPVKWEGPGLPTIAPKEIESKADTVQRPEPEKPWFGGDDSRASTVGWIALGVVLVGGAFFLSKYAAMAMLEDRMSRRLQRV